MVDAIIQKISTYNKNSQKQRLKEVFGFVQNAYTKEGLDIKYPLEVLKLLLPLKPDDDAVIAVMLYPLYVVDALNEEVLKSKFSESVANLVLELRKLEVINYEQNDTNAQVEILRRMFFSMAKDLRSILIALTFRLYKMQYLDELLERESREMIARETLDVYVPIAGRLGVYRIKTQLEDYSFKYAFPDKYEFICSEMEKLGASRRYAIELISGTLRKFFIERGLNLEVFGRLKSVYSVYKKMERKGLKSIDDLYDVFAMRIIVPTIYGVDGEEAYDDLYKVLGMIHSKWRPISKRFKDYVAVPKPNGYQSLHTVLLGLAPKDLDQPVEVQVRSVSMHEQAEYGVASHWLYKDNINEGKIVHSQINWLRNLEGIGGSFVDTGDVMHEVALDIFKDRIFVLTPRGEVKDLPFGACPIDFAYAVHTDLGHACVMAKVNGVLVPLDHELKNGDVVEIVAKKESAPKLQWLSMVKSSGTKSKIKAWFASLNRENNIKEGRRLLNAQLERLGKPLLDQNYSILKTYLGEKLNLVRRESLVEEVGKGAKMANDVIRKIFPYEKVLTAKVSKDKSQQLREKLKEAENLSLEEKVLVGGESGLPIKMAACCLPNYADGIIGYVTRGSRVTIHKYGCNLLHTLNKDRIIFANWAGLTTSNVEQYRVTLRLKVYSRVGLMRDVTSVISKLGVDIVSVDIKTDNGLNVDHYVVDLNSLDQFDLLLDKLEAVDGVLEVKRVD